MSETNRPKRIVTTSPNDSTLKKKNVESFIDQIDRIGEQRYKSIITTTVEGIADYKTICDADGNVINYMLLNVNPSFEALTGFKKSDIEGKTATNVFQTNEPPYLDIYKTVLATKQPITFETHFAPSNKYIQISVFSTDHNKFTTLIRELEERTSSFSTLTEITGALDERVRELNSLFQVAAVTEQLSTFSDDVVKQLIEIISAAFPIPENISARIRIYEKYYQGDNFEETLWRYSRPIVIRGNEVGSLNLYRRQPQPQDLPHVFSEEKIKFINLVADRLQWAMEKIHNRMERNQFESLFHVIESGVIVFDDSRNIIFINEIAQMLTGWTHEEAAGKPLMDVLHVCTAERIQSTFEQLVSDIYHATTSLPLILTLRDGTERMIHFKKNPRGCGQDKLFGGFFIFNEGMPQDNSGKNHHESEKFEALSLLAGGIAHSFNNILMSVLGNISLAKMTLDPKSEAYDILAKAEQKSLHARELTLELLSFSDYGKPMTQPTLISPLLKDVVKNFHASAKFRFRYALQHDLCPVEINENQVKLAIGNIVTNAMEAMPQGGIIHVSAEQEQIHSAKSLPLSDGNFVKITIADTGEGISEHNLKRIFDPYFTTKEKRNGLGLASAYTIIKSHNGHISVDSELAAGTKIHIYLPVAEEMSATAVGGDEEKANRTCKILIMDDEDVVRDIAGRILNRFGYAVCLAKDGAEAIELYQKTYQTNNPIQIAILDLWVPGGLGGRETLVELRKLNPHIKAIVSSGYSSDPVVTDYQRYGFSGAITKPFRIGELKQAVENLIPDNVIAAKSPVYEVRNHDKL